MTQEQKDEIIQEIRDLRDADFHNCPHDLFQSTYGKEGELNECSCKYFDAVIEKIEKL